MASEMELWLKDDHRERDREPVVTIPIAPPRPMACDAHATVPSKELTVEITIRYISHPILAKHYAS